MDRQRIDLRRLRGVTEGLTETQERHAYLVAYSFVRSVELFRQLHPEIRKSEVMLGFTDALVLMIMGNDDPRARQAVTEATVEYIENLMAEFEMTFATKGEGK